MNGIIGDVILTDEDWRQLWHDVGARLATERAAGRGHLMTEDVVRYQTVLALEHFGVAPARLTPEFLSPHLRGGKVDLMVDAPVGAAIEFKFPRDSSTGISPDTMTFGGLLKDVIRIPSVGAVDAWIVQALSPRLARYLRDAAARVTLTWPFAAGDHTVITSGALSGLPLTAARALGGHTLMTDVRLLCQVVHPVDDGLTLYAHRVIVHDVPEPAVKVTRSGDADMDMRCEPARSPAAPVPPAAATRDGARREILAAVTALLARSGASDVSLTDIVEEMHRRGTGYADSTIRTMVTAHLCAEATGPGVAGYDDLTRTERGRYRPQRTHTS